MIAVLCIVLYVLLATFAAIKWWELLTWDEANRYGLIFDVCFAAVLAPLSLWLYAVLAIIGRRIRRAEALQAAHAERERLLARARKEVDGL